MIILQIEKQELVQIIEDCLDNFLKKNERNPKNKEIKEEMLTITEAAKKLHLEKSTLYKKVHLNEIPFYKIKKRLYFSSTEIENYIKKGRNKTNDELKIEAGKYIDGQKNK